MHPNCYSLVKRRQTEFSTFVYRKLNTPQGNSGYFVPSQRYFLPYNRDQEKYSSSLFNRRLAPVIYLLKSLARACWVPVPMLLLLSLHFYTGITQPRLISSCDRTLGRVYKTISAFKCRFIILKCNAARNVCATCYIRLMCVQNKCFCNRYHLINSSTSSSEYETFGYIISSFWKINNQFLYWNLNMQPKINTRIWL